MLRCKCEIFVHKAVCDGLQTFLAALQPNLLLLHHILKYTLQYATGSGSAGWGAYLKALAVLAPPMQYQQ